jgi:hypothetical protein
LGPRFFSAFTPNPTALPVHVRTRYQRPRRVSTLATRSNVGGDLDENRVILSYSLPLG